MCGWRFRLLGCIRFDVKKTRGTTGVIDNLAAVRGIWDLSIHSCRVNYSPSNILTVHEMVGPFHGNCSFRIYMPQKRHRCGLRVFALCDVRNSYAYNLVRGVLRSSTKRCFSTKQRTSGHSESFRGPTSYKFSQYYHRQLVHLFGIG